MNLQDFDTNKDNLVTYQGRGSSQQPAAQSGMAHNDVQRDIDKSRQEFGSDFVFSDTETFPQLFNASSTVLTNARCGSRFSLANEKLVFNTELNSEIEYGQLTTMVVPGSQVEMDISTQKKDCFKIGPRCYSLAMSKTVTKSINCMGKSLHRNQVKT